MLSRFSIAIVSVGLLWCGCANAQVITRYDFRADFAAAAGPLLGENFNGVGADTSFSTNPISFGVFTIAGSGGGQPIDRNLIDVQPQNTTFTIDNSTYALVQINDDSQVTLTFANPITAFGADFTGFGDSEDTSVRIGSTTLASPFNGRTFVGYVSDTPFTTFTFFNPTLPDNFGMDNLAFSASAAAPEPGAWALMISGFGVIGASMRIRRRKALFAA